MDLHPAIIVDGLTKHFLLRGSGSASASQLVALNNVTFSIPEGECVGLIGPNGSGKSTLLKVLSGILKPSAGTVELNGRVASILSVGAGFHPELSGRDNVFLYGQLLGFKRSEISAVYDRIVEFSGVAKFINEPVKHYSNGMYLRLAFSTIVFLDFDIYLLDEVLGVGDSAFRIQIKDLFNDREWRQNRTFLISSHNHTELIFTTDRTIELENGELRADGDSDEVIRAYEKKRISKTLSASRSDEYFKNLELHTTVNGENSASMFNSDGLVVTIIGDKTERTKCELGIIVKDVFGNIVFSVSPLQSGISMHATVGSFKLSMAVPPRYFNQGTYYFHLSGFNELGNVFETSVLGVVEVQPEEVLLAYHDGRTLGAVKPFFEWKME
jgi:ABC-type polysaccharide/polyol phosphate transport system ATPase subunit